MLRTQGLQAPSALELVRCVATARIVMPKSMVRLSAGRNTLSFSEQVRSRLFFSFLLGVNGAHPLQQNVQMHGCFFGMFFSHVDEMFMFLQEKVMRKFRL